jgi:hypothetical protein
MVGADRGLVRAAGILGGKQLGYDPSHICYHQYYRVGVAGDYMCITSSTQSGLSEP